MPGLKEQFLRPLSIARYWEMGGDSLRLSFPGFVMQIEHYVPIAFFLLQMSCNHFVSS